MTARDIKLKNNMIYNDEGDEYEAVLEGKFVSKFSYTDVNRLGKGKTQSIDSAHVEVTLTVSAVNADLKYDLIDKLHSGKTPIIPMLIGEMVDKEAGNKERVKLTNIHMNPEELTIWEAKAEGNDIAKFDIKGITNNKPVFLDKLPTYEE